VLGKLVYDWGGGQWEEFYLEFPGTEEHKWLSKEGATLELLNEVESTADMDKKVRMLKDKQNGNISCGGLKPSL
jgi:hypothetical protein